MSESKTIELGYVCDPIFKEHLTSPGHPERPERIDAVDRAISVAKERINLVQLPIREARPEELALVHPEDYIAWVKESCESGTPRLDVDTSVCRDSYRIASFSAGAALEGVDHVLGSERRRAFCGARPPGHHAEKARAMGFCLFNNAALAAEYAICRSEVERVLIIDWDVHHGNGTQEIFYDRGDVFYFSTHQVPLYPGTGAAQESGWGPGEGKTLNIPLRPGAGDDEILYAFREQLAPQARDFGPDLVIVSAGFDGHAMDPLSNTEISTSGFGQLTRVVVEIAEEHSQGKIVSILEGGYDLDTLSDCVQTHLFELSNTV